MQRLEVSGALRPINVSLGVKRLNVHCLSYYSCNNNASLRPQTQFNTILRILHEIK